MEHLSPLTTRAGRLSWRSAALVLLPACGVDSLPGGDGGAGQDSGIVLGQGLGSLDGRVLDADGAGVAGVALTTQPRGYTATSDGDGRFGIELLPPDRYLVVAAADPWLTVSSETVEVLADQATAIELVLAEPRPAASLVQVRVLGPDGLPLEGAVLSTSTGLAASTDAEGRVELPEAWGAELELLVEAEGTWSRGLSGLDIGQGGGLQWEVQLSGRPDDGTPSVGSAACGECHPDQGQAHAGTRHARAHGTEPGEALEALFQAGARLELGNGSSAQLVSALASRRVQLRDVDGTQVELEIGGFIGDPEQATVPWTQLGAQRYPLPLAFVAGDAERAGYPDAEARLVAYQLQRWFDATGALDLVDGAPDPATSADRVCLPCHVSGFEASPRSDGGMDLQGLLRSASWDEDGVGCERCHGPGGAHVAAATEDRAFTITRPELLDPVPSLDVCGQCHARSTSAEDALPWPWTGELGVFEPGALLADYATSTGEHWPSGAAAETRMQVDELRLSTHGGPEAGQMRCHDCHDAHGAGLAADGTPAPQSLRMDPDDNALCLSCHLGMDFDGSVESAFLHTGHLVYDPDGPGENARCTGCHMPLTSSELFWSARSGAGDHASHLMAYVEPQATVDFFDAAGLDSMVPGSFPIHACSDCHAYNAWRWEPSSLDFIGPYGDPSLRASHVEYQAAAEELWP